MKTMIKMPVKKLYETIISTNSRSFKRPQNLYALVNPEKDALLSKACQSNLEQTELINTQLKNLFHVLFQAATSSHSCFSTLPWKNNLQILTK